MPPVDSAAQSRCTFLRGGASRIPSHRKRLLPLSLSSMALHRSIFYRWREWHPAISVSSQKKHPEIRFPFHISHILSPESPSIPGSDLSLRIWRGMSYAVCCLSYKPVSSGQDREMSTCRTLLLYCLRVQSPPLSYPGTILSVSHTPHRSPCRMTYNPSAHNPCWESEKRMPSSREYSSSYTNDR